jgi:pilus assembly protein CpaE
LTGRFSPTVLVASEDLSLLDELVRHLDQIPHWRLVGSARSSEELSQSVVAHLPDAVLISEGLARSLAESSGASFGDSTRLVVLGRQTSDETFRAALKLGARGFVLWPREQRELRGLVEHGLESARPRRSVRGSLTALWGPKGGSGTSVLAAHLAGVLSSLQVNCLLVDLDLDHGDQSPILGAKGETKTIVDLLSVVEELSPSMVDSIAWQHQRGFKAIFSPGSPDESGVLKAVEVARALSAVRDFSEHVVADLPSGFSELVFAVSEEATRLLLVITPDLLSLRRGRQAVQTLGSAGIGLGSVEIVLNRSGGDISRTDVEAVLGREVVAEIPPNVGLLRSPDRGELAPGADRLLEALARGIGGLPQPQRKGLGGLFRK